ncbi:hypothetical protein CJ263_17235 [Maribacter cobaltidurans]|uniref:Uncharacterized protein n=2 Tax=Maribacter cobaltidurans TaxID=1178778 RepID=A0A223VAD9_9FLAO|nr:hypothetical protein CJ263_17235 [Maribacter cobaltidurans]GGD84834.1 hypothetical protein GCM10011412_23250 [Maribacter cobaltidurans]
MFCEKSVMEKLNFKLFMVLFLIVFACKNINSSETTENLHKPTCLETTLKKATKTYFYAWSKNDSTLIDSVSVKNLIRNVNGEIVSTNQNELLKTMYFWHTAMPNFKMVDKEINVVGNRTYVNWSGTGTNTGMYANTPPTGKIGHIEGMSILTFNNDGQIVYEGVFFDKLGLLEQWGYSVIPPIMK